MTDQHRPEVLFVYVHNPGRSQMAAALLGHHAAGLVTVRSAGSEPADRLNPAVIGGRSRDPARGSKQLPVLCEPVSDTPDL